MLEDEVVWADELVSVVDEDEELACCISVAAEELDDESIGEVAVEEDELSVASRWNECLADWMWDEDKVRIWKQDDKDMRDVKVRRRRSDFMSRI